MPPPKFIRVVIGELYNEEGVSSMNTLFNVGDLNADGRMDVFTSGRNGEMAWFENLGEGRFQRRHIANISNQECGGLAFDLTGNGLPDIINGGDYASDELCWWENPGDSECEWKRRLIVKTGFHQFHDEMIGDVTGDGTLSLVYMNQGNGSLCRIPLPNDPTTSHWPQGEMIATGLQEKKQPEEGMAIADIDGDGKNEIIAGTSWYKYTGGQWERYKYACDYITTLIAVGDIDGDGKPEIVLSEGDACIYGYPEGGKLGYFKPEGDIRAMWKETRLDEGLLDPHSLHLADLCGTGSLDILVGEIGVKDKFESHPPRLMLYENKGNGEFERHVLDEGVGTHHARLIDLQNRGTLDIVSRPLHGADKWKVFAWLNQSRCI